MRVRSLLFLCATFAGVCALLVGCTKSVPIAALPDSGIGAVVPDSGEPPPDAPDGVANPRITCGVGSELIYVLDAGGRLATLDPRTESFTDVGYIDCPGGARAWALAVDSAGDGYMIGRTTRDVFHIDTSTAACEPALWPPVNEGFTAPYQFAFVSELDEPESEELFVMGIVGEPNQIPLGRADVATGRIETVGWGSRLALGMTGNGKGELWIFDQNQGVLVQLDRTDGSVIRQIDIPEAGQVMGTGAGLAYWGGEFWVFSTDFGGTTSMWTVNAETEAVVQRSANIGYGVIGAAVSVCAPVEVF